MERDLLERFKNMIDDCKDRSGDRYAVWKDDLELLVDYTEELLSDLIVSNAKVQRLESFRKKAIRDRLELEELKKNG